MDMAKDRRGFLAAAGAVAAGASAVAQAQAQTAVPGSKVKILAVACSPRKGKSTFEGLTYALQGAQAASRERIETELIELAGLSIPVFNPASTDSGDFAGLIPRLSAPNVGGIIVGTPVYFSGMTSLCKAFLDHCGVFRKQGMKLRNRAAGVLAVGGVRNGGQEKTIAGVQDALMCQEMIIVGDGRPSARSGATLVSSKDSVGTDDFGVGTARNLGRHVAEVALMLAGE